VAVAGGGYHSLGLKSDGTIVAWGDNGMGQCDVPAPNADFVAVAGGLSHSLGLKSDRTILAWGDNRLGQCTVPGK
jgi:alpha-tubulin suppressor-like RCC1 family protein